VQLTKFQSRARLRDDTILAKEEKSDDIKAIKCRKREMNGIIE